MNETRRHLKIGLLHYTMPPVVGGVERVLAAHARLFREDGHEVVELSANNVPGFTDAGDHRENSRMMRQFLEEMTLDLLCVHNVFTMPFCRTATAVCRGLAAADLRVISWVHDLAAANPYYSIPAHDVLRSHPEGATVVAISEERAVSYRNVTGHPEVIVVPNGIDALGELAGGLLTKRPDLRGKLTGAFPVLLHPTRLLRRKNIRLGVQMVADLKKRGLSPRLLITGAPEPFSGDQAAYRAEVDALVAKLGVQNDVLFLGDDAELTDAEVGQLYAVADGLFFPSEQEGFGLPVLEAAVRGLPVFASDTQPLATLAARNGLVFPLTLASDFIATQMCEFFASDRSSQVRKIVRSEFDWQGIYERHMLPLLSPQ